MTAALIVFELWTLCCGAVIAAAILGVSPYAVARWTPALAVAFLLVRGLV